MHLKRILSLSLASSLAVGFMPITLVTNLTMVEASVVEEANDKDGNEFCSLSFISCRMSVQDLMRKHATKQVPIETMMRIAHCESSLNPIAKNKQSSAKGLFQFLDGTWAWIKAKGNQYDAEESIKQFVKWYPRYPSWWQCH